MFFKIFFFLMEQQLSDVVAAVSRVAPPYGETGILRDVTATVT